MWDEITPPPTAGVGGGSGWVGEWVAWVGGWVGWPVLRQPQNAPPPPPPVDKQTSAPDMSFGGGPGPVFERRR